MRSWLYFLFIWLVTAHAHISKKVVFPTSLHQIDLACESPPNIRDKIARKLTNVRALFSESLRTRTITLNRKKLPTIQAAQYLQQPTRKHERLKFFKNFPLLKGCRTAKKRLLILMSDTGGGHRASAEALGQAMQDQYPGKVDVNIMDIWTDHGKFPFNKSVPIYRYLAKHPLLWRAFYSYGLFPPTKLFTELDSQRVCYKSFKKAIEEADPDFVVSVHPLCQLMPISIVKEMNKKRLACKPRIPFVTVVTDLGSAHSCWFDRRVDAVYVPSEEVRTIALRNNMPANRILLKGLPIRPAFWKPSVQPRSVLRRALGIPQDSKTVLLMGGGDGVGGLGSIATEITRKLRALDFKSNLIVVCGKNKQIQDQLTQKLVKSPGAPRTQRSGEGGTSCYSDDTILSKLSPLRIINRMAFKSNSIDAFNRRRTCAATRHEAGAHVGVIVKGFVHNVDELMTASDLLVTKAGPGTIAEAMTRGLPVILSSYLPGQVRLLHCLSRVFDAIKMMSLYFNISSVLFFSF